MTDLYYPQQTFQATASNAAPALVQLKQPGADAVVRLVTLPATPPMLIKFGDVNVQVTTSDMLFLSGAVEVFRLSATQTHMSVLSTGASNTVYATVGQAL